MVDKLRLWESLYWLTILATWFKGINPKSIKAKLHRPCHQRALLFPMWVISVCFCMTILLTLFTFRELKSSLYVNISICRLKCTTLVMLNFCCISRNGKAYFAPVALPHSSGLPLSSMYQFSSLSTHSVQFMGPLPSSYCSMSRTHLLRSWPMYTWTKTKIKRS